MGAPRASLPLPISQTASASILQFARYDRTVRLSVPTSSGLTDVLEYKNSLSESAWKPLTSVPGDGAVKILADLSAPTAQRFYRARVESDGFGIPLLGSREGREANEELAG